MKCRNKGCGREIDDDSIYCKWCGEKQIRDRKKKDEISVPKPRRLKSGAWNIELRAEGASITEPTPELCQAKARAIRYPESTSTMHTRRYRHDVYSRPDPL